MARTPPYANMASIPLGKARILGLNWDTDSDEIYFEIERIIDLARKLPLTKRSVLKLLAKIFDPLGFLSVFTINLK